MVEVAGVRAVELSRCAAAFKPASPASESRIAFWGSNFRLVARMSVIEALPVLSRAGSDPPAHRTLAFWGRTALVVLQLVTQRNALYEADDEPGGAWRLARLSNEAEARIRAAAAMMPTSELGEGASPGESRDDVQAAGRSFLDAVADGMPRCPVGALVLGGAAQLDRFEDQLSRTTRAFASVVGV